MDEFVRKGSEDRDPFRSQGSETRVLGSTSRPLLLMAPVTDQLRASEASAKVPGPLASKRKRVTCGLLTCDGELLVRLGLPFSVETLSYCRSLGGVRTGPDWASGDISRRQGDYRGG